MNYSFRIIHELLRVNHELFNNSSTVHYSWPFSNELGFILIIILKIIHEVVLQELFKRLFMNYSKNNS